MTTQPDPNPRLDAAQSYAAAGWPVFPCIPGEKVPATVSGFKDATTDPERIADWWTRSPGRNVAIATGAPGPDVVDVDVHEGGSGFGAWNEAKRAGLVENPMALIRTPSGGMHAYFTGSDQGSGRIPDRHLDFRSNGGYVVAPPSATSGRPYVVVTHQAESAQVDWAAIRALVAPQRSQPSAGRREASIEGTIDRLAGWLERRDPGDRNFPLFYAAKTAAAQGLLDETARARLMAASLRSGLRGGETEARRTIDSGARSARSAPAAERPPFQSDRQLEAG